MARLMAHCEADRRILSWLETVQESTTCHYEKKRKRTPSITPSENVQVVTPPHTRRTARSMSHTPKKQLKRPAGPNADDDIDLTPRPVPGTMADDSTTESTTSRGANSRTGSPRKRLCYMAIREDGIICVSFPSGSAAASRYPLPDPLRIILQTFRRIDSSVAIIPHTAGQRILENAIQQDLILPPSSIAPPDDAKGPPTHPARPTYHGLGPTPSLDDTVDLARWATELSATGADEGPWNAFVHARIFALALYPAGRLQHGLVGITHCTSAAVIKEYLESARGAAISEKKVDFCLHVDPYYDEKNGGDIADSIDKLALTLPLNSINHTDHEALATRPIVVSIETKKPDAEKAADAQLQIGVWHIAQWKLLETLVADRLTKSGGSTDGAASAASTMPDFLPAITIKGHDWYFVATTRSGPKTVRY